MPDEDVPVYPTIASQFNDPGVSWMFVNLCRRLKRKLGRGHRVDSACDFAPVVDTSLKEPRATVLIPGARIRYLAEIAEQGRGVNGDIERQAEAAERAQACWSALEELGDEPCPRRSICIPMKPCAKAATAACSRCASATTMR